MSIRFFVSPIRGFVSSMRGYMSSIRAFLSTIRASPIFRHLVHEKPFNIPSQARKIALFSFWNNERLDSLFENYSV